MFSNTNLIAVFLCAALGACANSGGSGSDLSERIEQDGYSFIPPKQSGWFIASRSSSRIALAKSGKIDGQSYLIEGLHVSLSTLTDLTQLRQFVAKINKREVPAPRFRIREHEISDTRIAGAHCVLTHLVAEDRQPETGGNVVTAMIVESVSTVCAHPTSAELGIRMTFLHRSFPEDRDRAFETYAQGVLLTQQFSPINKQFAN
ncbi:MAG: hypothetical protein GTO41_13445 [Burkholderiales bacterium]|nr:hypothetical protein [Burkholderiales bacterium]